MSNDRSAAEVERSGTLFGEEHLGVTEVPLLELESDKVLRVVHWGENENGETLGRPCLVLCDGGERNIRSIRRKATLCGTSCDEAASTSGIEPADKNYCQACLALAGNGVLR